MVTAVLHDPLKRAFNILPETARFGPIRAGGTYEITISAKNEDVITQRINLRQSKDKRIKVRMETTGPVSLTF